MTTNITITELKRTGLNKEECKVLINGLDYWADIITLNEFSTKKFVTFLRRPYGKNRAKYQLWLALEDYINSI